MTYGEERLHFPDNLKPEKKSSTGWIPVFMAVSNLFISTPALFCIITTIDS